MPHPHDSVSMNLDDVSLWILSWQRWDRLEHMLASLQNAGLLDLIHRKRIFFQEINARDREVAERFGLEVFGSPANIGIAPAWQAMLAHTPEPFTLMLENDCPVIESPHVVHRRLQEARDWLARGELDACQLRSIPYPGAKFNVCAKYCRYWSCPGWQTASAWRRWLRPLKARRLLDSAPLCINNAEARHPEIDRLSADIHRVSSRYWGWSNQSVLIRTAWMRDQVLPRVFSHPSRRLVQGAQDIERALNRRWWREQDFRIGMSQGFFTHLD
jgi:hypothetical protein